MIAISEQVRFCLFIAMRENLFPFGLQTGIVLGKSSRGFISKHRSPQVYTEYTAGSKVHEDKKQEREQGETLYCLPALKTKPIQFSKTTNNIHITRFKIRTKFRSGPQRICKRKF